MKTKNLIQALATIVAATILGACVKERYSPQTVNAAEEATGCAVAAVPPVYFDDAPATKLGAACDEASGLTFSWDEDDAMGVYSSTGGFARYSLLYGPSHGVFSGEGFALKEGCAYYAFYPYSQSSADGTAVPLSYSGQTVTGSGDNSAALSRAYIHSAATADSGGNAWFSFRHAGSYLRTSITLPAGTSIDKVSFVPMYGEMPTDLSLNLEDGSSTVVSSSPVMDVTADSSEVPENGVFTLWTAMPPHAPKTDYALLIESAGTTYTARHSASNFTPGKAYRWDISPGLLGNEGNWAFTSVTENSAFSPSKDVIPSGQYSGITYLGGTRYAVVDDKLAGGGITYFDITIDEKGTVTAAGMTVPEGTSSSDVSGRDNEGIAYVPSTGTLFVSSENDQSIREYTLDGFETGRSLAVPEDLAVGKISSNKGFEALTYDAAGKVFWTVTEGELGKDAFLPRTLRLQSFGDDLQPAERFFYRTDEPAKSAAEAAAANSYVFGVPALAALPDGRLLVMEREVYVPNGGTLEKFFNSFAKTKIYVVNPHEDTAGVLRKNLVKEISTSALNLANYEGMCIGPTLSDGGLVVMLVPDSQGGSGGLTNEYIKTLVVK